MAKITKYMTNFQVQSKTMPIIWPVPWKCDLDQLATNLRYMNVIKDRIRYLSIQTSLIHIGQVVFEKIERIFEISRKWFWYFGFLWVFYFYYIRLVMWCMVFNKIKIEFNTITFKNNSFDSFQTDRNTPNTRSILCLK